MYPRNHARSIRNETCHGGGKTTERACNGRVRTLHERDPGIALFNFFLCVHVLFICTEKELKLFKQKKNRQRRELNPGHARDRRIY